MKRGIVIIGETQTNGGLYEEELNNEQRHAYALKSYCQNQNISLDISTVNGHMWSEELAKRGILSITVEDKIIVYIPAEVTDYQYERFKIYRKKYRNRKPYACSFYKKGNSIKKILIEGEKEEVWNQIDEDIEENYMIYKEGIKSLCMRR